MPDGVPGRPGASAREPLSGGVTDRPSQPSALCATVIAGSGGVVASSGDPVEQQVFQRRGETVQIAGPEQAARAALFLASDLAGAVTGQMLTVDCGEFHR
jgi:NAD(P)-dependent dehydrogenase (short-subunit alcohol dehydrogenase family)